MKQILKGFVSLSMISLMLIGCTSSPKKGKTILTQNGQRIYIPQEKIFLDRPVKPKIMPQSYSSWLIQGDNQSRVREYERFLESHDVGNSREILANQLPTLKVFKYLVASKVLTEFEVTSVYRDLPLNQCAGGASSSRHLYNSAIDFRIGPEYLQPSDYAFIENSKFKLCQFWQNHGQSLNMGLGLYSSGQIHIDTQGYRTWGPDLTRNTSLCHF